MVLRSILLICLIACPLAAEAQMRGHGGPVRALAVSPDGRTAMSGSFDQSAILWTLATGTADQVLRFHEGAVNAVVALPDGRFATGGEDGRIAIWAQGRSEPDRIIEGHRAPVVGLAVSPDGGAIGSASWDGTARITPLGAGEARVLEGHQANVNAIAFLADGRAVTAGYDATLRIWPKDAGPAIIVTVPTPLNAVATAGNAIAAAGADGIVRMFDADGVKGAEVPTQDSPVIALAVSPDGARIAAAAIRGAVAVIDRSEARVLFNLVGPGLPIWSLAFLPDGRELLTGGTDRLIRRWDMTTGEPVGAAMIGLVKDPLAEFSGERGAEVFRACAACHTLTPEGGNRAGPTLHGVFGRRIATAPGYNFSDALKKLDIVWNAQTISKLFEIGPSRYTPGTKMPEQHVTNPADRAALVDFLERATRAK